MTYIHDQILPEGTHIGVYEIRSVAKVGAFDIIYRAWNHHLKERVKIQEYFPHDIAMRTGNGLGVEPKSADQKADYEYGLQAFLNQAEMLTQIEHSNIATAENVLPFNGTAYLILRAQEGTPLSKLIQSQASFAETELKFILTAMLSALEKIHAHNIVHGGIQPATILLRKDGEPVLTGFSAARLAMAARTAQLASELAIGYAAAEQDDSAKTIGPATDFYALGATLYECMTHKQPIAAQDRLQALRQGEPDPMILASESLDTAYSAEWLQAINWMLQPEYQQRPQAANAILGLLKTEQPNDPARSSSTQQNPEMDGNSGSRNYRMLAVMTGIVALATAGLWFNEKPAEILDENLSTAVNAPLSQPTSSEGAAASESKETAPISLAAIPSNSGAGLDKITEIVSEKIDPADKQSAENALPIANDAIASELSNKGSTQSASDSNPPMPVINSSSESKQQVASKQPIDAASLKKHLAAAEKAMKAGRFTTPLKDNAHKHYQAALAIDPNNAQANAGLKKIVDRYVQYIEKAKSTGQSNRVELYLQRAEAVLPDDPKLQKIRAALAAAQ
jgi:serine/threonine protein kinase